MTRSILSGLLALLSVTALGVLPVACQSGGVGDPCTPEDEYNTQFAGFKVAEENIESRSFQCQTRICLVNHFQGRQSCPAGQATPVQCIPANHGSECAAGQDCVLSQTYAPACVPCDPGDTSCSDTCTPLGLNKCDPASQYCGCAAGQTINGVNFACEPATTCATGNCPQVLNSYVCHTKAVPNGKSFCQQPTSNPSTNVSANKGLDCCVPGTDSPVAVSVCGQCNATSKRNADQAVYCTCRCCAPCCPAGTSDAAAPDMGCSNDASICGPACDPNFNYCDCPSGYTCAGIRTNVGLGDNQLAGAYCIKSGTAFTSTSEAMCGAGALGGYVGDSSCAP